MPFTRPASSRAPHFPLPGSKASLGRTPEKDAFSPVRVNVAVACHASPLNLARVPVEAFFTHDSDHAYSAMSPKRPE